MLTTKLTNIANAIRNKTQTSVAMTLDEMPSKIESIETASKPNLQDKEVTPTKQTQVVNYDEEYDGLNQVTVKPIPSEYIIPSGVLEITENGSKDVTEYSSVNVNVASSGGGAEVTNGIIINQYDDDGFPIEMTVNGLTINTTDLYLFGTFDTLGYSSLMIKRLKKLILNDISGELPEQLCTGASALEEFVLQNGNVTALEEDSFRYCTSLKSVDMSNSIITTIKASALKDCANLFSVKLPRTITTMGNSCFANCTSLVSFSLDTDNSIAITPTTALRSQFYNCTGLKGVWLGNVSNIRQYGFSGCTGLKKIFINKKRATVEAFSGYSSAFSNNAVTTDVIICNDDEGFMTKEQFDAIDWATYIG